MWLFCCCGGCGYVAVAVDVAVDVAVELDVDGAVLLQYCVAVWLWHHRRLWLTVSMRTRHVPSLDDDSVFHEFDVLGFAVAECHHCGRRVSGAAYHLRKHLRFRCPAGKKAMASRATAAARPAAVAAFDVTQHFACVDGGLLCACVWLCACACACVPVPVPVPLPVPVWLL